ncbi:MAG: mannonate dehydratase [Lachnospiraceae bacterium]|nr:mannonate dehydratase [Lachnospiraceae bacterium]
MIDRVKVAYIFNEPLKHYAQQLGVKYAVAGPNARKYAPYSHPWDYGVLRETAQAVKDAGMEWAVLEGIGFIDGVKLGLESRDEEIAHFRDVVGTADNFREAWHHDGKTDMFAAMKAYYEVGFEGVMRPDHVPTMYGDDNDHPGYAILGNLVATGYMYGLMEACEKELGLR